MINSGQGIPRAIALMALLSFIFPSCQSQRELHLDNALSESLKKKAAAETTVPEETPSAPSVSAADIPEGAFPELAMMEVPGDFVRVSDMHVISPEAKAVVEGLMPNASAVWGSSKKKIIMMCARTEMNSGQIKEQTRAAFLEELKVVGEMAAQFYRFKKDAKTGFHIDENQHLLALKFKASFEVNGISQTHWRYFFYYRPDYRFDFFMAGDTGDIEALQDEMDARIRNFEERLKWIYPEGIRFQS